MGQLEDKRQIIYENDHEFADILAARVLHKPKVVVWMILIPVLLVLYLNDLKKYKDGRNDFIENYLITKKRALDEAFEAIEAARECDTAPLAEIADLPDSARQFYAELLSVLTTHYMMLLKTNSKDYDSMVRNAYHNRTNYLLFINQLNRVEKALNDALRPNLNQDLEGVNDVISSIEKHSEQIRKDISQRIFS